MDLVKVVVEILGTFFFLSVILQTLTDSSIGPIAVAVTLLGAIYFGASTSGAHFNPAVSFSMFMKGVKDFNLNVLVTYILAQLVGAALAVKFNDFIKK
jgi:glycerol uptake facilitator-like aquaporin